MQELSKKVGIVIPIYNVEKYLRQCLDSIVNQTYTNLEILLINDGSTDYSLKIAKDYASKDSRITIIDKENGGLSSARNTGIEFFSGELVGIALSLRGMSEAKDEAIHNTESHFKDFIANTSARFKSMDCHENQRFSRNDEVVSPQKSDIIDCHAENKARNDAVGSVDCHDSLRNLAMTENTSPRNDAVGSNSISCGQDYGLLRCFAPRNDAANPYQIHAIYSLKSSLEIPTIDYLQFVDSDDYIELDCVEQCVRRMQGVDVLWFNVKTFLDGVKKSDWKSNIWHFGYTNEVILSRKDWGVRLFERKLHFFYFSWSGVIDFEFLKRIRLQFINGIIQEDDMFGILLFAQSNHIYVYPKKLYHYRIRANSIMNYSNDYEAKVAGFFAKSAEVFKDNYAKRAYHKASSFMQTALALDAFLQNSQEERLKHIIATYLMPTYVFYAHKILYFSQDPLNLIPQFQKLEKYLEDFNNNALLQDSLKEELTYRLGNVSLNLIKNPKKLLSLPKILFSMIHNDKEAQKAYKENIKNYQLTLPNFKNLANKANATKIKQHLSYKLGVCILKAHQIRYFGGYLWLPFHFIWTFISFKLSYSKRDSTLLNSINRLSGEVSHLNWQIWNAYASNSSDVVTRLQRLGISNEYHDIFSNMLAQGKPVISYCKNREWLDLLVECKAPIHYFEPDPVFCGFLKEKYKESTNVIFYPNALSNIEQVQIQARDNRGGGIHPSIYYTSGNAYETKSLKISEVLQRISNLYLLILDLDFETCAIIEELLESKEYQKISYIFCKVNAIFAESKRFESLKQRIDSTPPPPAQLVFCVKQGNLERNLNEQSG